MALACGGGGGGAHKPSSGAGDFSVSSGLESSIHEHSLFFDRLVELIPARFYVPSADEDKPWYQGLSKAEKASFKAESRRHLKESRRARFDPQKSATTLDLLKKSIEASKSKDADGSGDDDDDKVEEEEEEEEEKKKEEEEEEEEEKEEEEEVEDDVARAEASEQHRLPVVAENESLTYEELQQRLKQRIANFRSCRNTRNPAKPRPKKEKNKRKSKKNKKKAALEREEEQQKRKREKLEAGNENNEKKNKKAKCEKAGKDPITADLSFGQVKIGDGDESRKKKKKLSKQQELARAMKLEEAKKDPEKGEVVSKKHSWKAAVDRAAGVKVHDNAKQLKVSINKDKKRQKKSSEKWKERMQHIDKNRAEKQKTRTDNIKGRIHQKKMRKIEKREKKLMRPGFEGRKEGYINE